MADLIDDDAFARFAQLHVLATAAQVEAGRVFQVECARLGTPVSLADALVKIGAITLAQRDIAEQRLLAQQKGGIQQLLHYRLIRKLGEGGMGAVYLAQDTINERSVALKVLPRQHSDNAEFMKRFQREADAMGRLHHENIVAAYSMGEDQGRHFFMMEYCEGETLDKRLDRDIFLPADEATRIVIQVARGLQYAHGQGIVHRDIKPSNIIVTPAGVTKILDLGLSKDLEHEASSFLTRTGVTVGTPHYMSPEQARGERDLDGRADLYSLGATYYHFLTGDTPFHGSSAFEVVNKHIHEQIPNPRDIREDIPDGVVHVVQRMMAKHRANRYRDCGELVLDLERVLEGMDPQSEAIDAVLSSVALPKVTRTLRRHFTAKTPARAPVAIPPTPPRAVLVVSSGDAGGGGRIGDTADRAFDAAVSVARRGGRRALVGVLRGGRALRSGVAAAYRAAAARLKTLPPRIVLLLSGSAVVAVLVLVVLAARSRQGPAAASVGRAEVTPGAAAPSVSAAEMPAEPAPALEPITAPAATAATPEATHAPAGTPVALPVPPAVPAVPPAGPSVTTMEEWIASVRPLPPDEQVRMVAGKLKALHPGFDGRLQHRVEEGRVTALDLSKTPIQDLAPLRALPGLQALQLEGTRVSDLAPLRDLPLRDLRIRGTKVGDLSPLRGKSLVALDCSLTPVSDLSPLEGMPLARLECGFTGVGNLTPLKGAPLSVLGVSGALVRDLTPVRSAPLKELACDFDPRRDAGLLREIRSLERINGMAAAEFWRTFDEAEALAKAVEPLAADPAWESAIDLLPLVEPGLDVVAGTWRVAEGGLVSDRTLDALVEIPFQPPEEYDFRVRFTRREGSAEVVQVLPRPGPPFAWLMGACANTVLGFARVGGKDADANATSVRMAWCLENDRPYTSVVQVRKDGVKAILNGREVARWKTGDGEPGPAPAWLLRDKGLPGLGSGGGVTAFHSAELLEVTGRGRLLRPSAAVVGEGSGLKGSYFIGRGLQDEPVFTRIDPVVDFDWDVFSPDSRIPVDSFSVRWEGQLQAQYSETYTFYTVADDAARLWVDGKPLVDDWRVTNRITESRGTIRLKAGEKVSIRMEYFEGRSGAVAKLFWSSPSTPKSLLPRSQLYPAP